MADKPGIFDQISEPLKNWKSKFGVPEAPIRTVSITSREPRINVYPKYIHGNIDEAYKVKIFDPPRDDDPFSGDMVVGYLNEDFVEEVSANWQNLMQIQSNAFENLLQILADRTLKSVLLYRQVWAGNDPFRGRLKLTFSAIKDAKDEVYNPIRVLEKMASPRIDEDVKIGRILRPPIPSARNPEKGIIIAVGKTFEYVGCILTKVAPTFGNKFNSRGYPMYADVDVDFQLVVPATKEDFDREIKRF
jgi:hypothetical protein